MAPEVKSLEEQEQCIHIAIPFTRTISPWKDLKSLINLTKLLKKLKPDIVHTHTPKAGLIGMWAAKFAAVPVRLHTIAGLPWMETKGMLRVLLRFIEKLTGNACVPGVPQFRHASSFFTGSKIGSGKMTLLGKGSSNGIDSNFFFCQ
jgi:hypothetical protein